MEKIKVVWVCSLSNPEIREHICLKSNRVESLLMSILGINNNSGVDSAIWNTNAINEMKHISEVELYVVCPIRNLSTNQSSFEIDGIHYFFIKDENSSLYRKARRYLFTRYSDEFMTNRFNICRVINEINPDLVHVIGAENPHYSLALMDIPKETTTILQLQALLSTLVNKTEGEQRKEYTYKSEIEQKLINRADYIGTTVPSFVEYIRNEIKPNARIVNTKLAMAQQIDLSEHNKEYDFVHFASMLGPSKATDVAIEAFGLVYKSRPTITMRIIGSSTPEFQNQMNARITELGIDHAVKIEGRLNTHDDVIKEIKKARYALLPLKIDIVPNTIHEAMANGIPVVTTVTPGTPSLNKKRESVLISSSDDIQGIANNMLTLIDDRNLYEELRQNAAITESEHDNNKNIINHWIEVYKAIVKNRIDGTPIPEQYFS